MLDLIKRERSFLRAATCSSSLTMRAETGQLWGVQNHSFAITSSDKEGR
jgi:hypothetical protein